MTSSNVSTQHTRRCEMAGRRRTRGTQTTTERRLANLSRMADRRLELAVTPADRVGAGADILRAAIVGLPPEHAQTIADRAVDALAALTETARRAAVAVDTLRKARDGRATEAQLEAALAELGDLVPTAAPRRTH